MSSSISLFPPFRVTIFFFLFFFLVFPADPLDWVAAGHDCYAVHTHGESAKRDPESGPRGEGLGAPTGHGVTLSTRLDSLACLSSGARTWLQGFMMIASNLNKLVAAPSLPPLRITTITTTTSMQRSVRPPPPTANGSSWQITTRMRSVSTQPPLLPQSVRGWLAQSVSPPTSGEPRRPAPG
ncbi:hypothetical protein BX600DRAFT_535159 [Xylariales sp. PMI_506]|nr:hypothetical protein BX600DRAFT_535159 [Xylariales sp. PMI_506]